METRWFVNRQCPISKVKFQLHLGVTRSPDPPEGVKKLLQVDFFHTFSLLKSVRLETERGEGGLYLTRFRLYYNF